MAGGSPTTSNFIVLCLCTRFSPGLDMFTNGKPPRIVSLPVTLFSVCNLKYLFESLE